MEFSRSLISEPFDCTHDFRALRGGSGKKTCLVSLEWDVQGMKSGDGEDYSGHASIPFALAGGMKAYEQAHHPNISDLIPASRAGRH